MGEWRSPKDQLDVDLAIADAKAKAAASNKIEENLIAINEKINMVEEIDFDTITGERANRKTAAVCSYRESIWGA